MSRRDDDLQREIRRHLELEAADREADGLSPDEARAAAARAFGNVTLTREDARAVWRPAWLDHIGQDLRYAFRLARRQPVFTIGAVLILAIGIGASTTIFGALHAVVLAPLPFDRPDALVRMTQVNRSRGVDSFSVSLPLYRDWRARSRSFQAMAARMMGTATVQGLGDPQRLVAEFMTHDMLSLLGVRLVIGRPFAPEEDARSGDHVVILAHGFWQRAFGLAPDVLGRQLTIDGRSHRIIGVAPPHVLPPDHDVILPLVPYVEDRRGFAPVDVYARLAPAVTVAQAESEMAEIARQLEREYPEAHQGWSVAIVPLAEALVGPRAPQVLSLLLAAVGVLLLVACANLSSLLLVRASTRTREMAIRAAVGGGRARLVRQLLIEALWLAAIGGGLGVALAYSGTRVMRTFAIAEFPRADQIAVDSRVLLFAIAVTAAAGLFAGLAPARQAAATDVLRGLKEGAPTIAGGRRGGRNALVVAQLALSILLLAAAGLVMRALDRLHRVDLGFTPGQIVTASIAPRDHPEAFLAALLDRVRALPDVMSAGATSGAPMATGNTSLNVYPVGQAVIPGTSSVQADWRIISDGYFGAMRTAILAGRDFSAGDTEDAPKVIAVNQTLARRLWGDSDPIGRQVDLGGGGGTPAAVIALVADTRSRHPGESPGAIYYVPAARGIWGSMTLVIRTAADADRLMPAIRSQVAALDPTLPVFDVRTMDELLRRRLGPQRLAGALLAGFAGLALVLAIAGIHGVMAHATGQRAREVAIRLALGARRWDVVRPLIRDGCMMVARGAAIGLAAALLVTRLMEGILAGVSPTDPATLAAAVALLTIAAVFACYLPARRVSRLDPVRVLRADG